jgi:hypothetical protein
VWPFEPSAAHKCSCVTQAATIWQALNARVARVARFCCSRAHARCSSAAHPRKHRLMDQWHAKNNKTVWAWLQVRLSLCVATKKNLCEQSLLPHRTHNAGQTAPKPYTHTVACACATACSQLPLGWIHSFDSNQINKTSIAPGPRWHARTTAAQLPCVRPCRLRLWCQAAAEDAATRTGRVCISRVSAEGSLHSGAQGCSQSSRQRQTRP